MPLVEQRGIYLTTEGNNFRPQAVKRRPTAIANFTETHTGFQ